MLGRHAECGLSALNLRDFARAVQVSRQWITALQRARPHSLQSAIAFFRRTLGRPQRPQPSQAQRCHPDPLSIVLSFLDAADFANAARTCRQWAAASRRKSAWPRPGIAQLADFSQQYGRAVVHVAGGETGRLNKVISSPARTKVASVSIYTCNSDDALVAFQQAAQLPSLLCPELRLAPLLPSPSPPLTISRSSIRSTPQSQEGPKSPRSHTTLHGV